MFRARFHIAVFFAWLAGAGLVHAQANDNFAGRIAVTGTGVSVVSDSSSATQETGEPNHAGFAGGKSLWWTWTAPATGVVNFSTFGSAGTGNLNNTFFSQPATSALAVYTGESLGTISEEDSSNHQPTTPIYEPSRLTNVGESFNLSVTAGTTYQIAVDDPGSYGSNAVVLSVNQPPTIVSNAILTGILGESFQYTEPFQHTLQASNTPMSYTATGLPPGMYLNSATGAISGAPQAVGNFAVNVSATNCAGTGSATVTFAITTPSTSINPPQIINPAMATGVVGETFGSFNILATYSPTSYTATGLPPGLGVDVSTGVITGTPTVSGTFPVSLSATNSVGTATAPLTIVVADHSLAPTIDNNAVAQGTVGSEFPYFYISTTGNSNAVESYTAADLPPGLRIASSGEITGTPTEAGTFSVPISAATAQGNAAATLTIEIAPAAASPTQNPNLLITSHATTSGMVGSPFSYTIVASGNPTAFTATALPPGLNFDSQTGIISGTPTAIGVFAIPIQAINATGSVEATLTITIGATYAFLQPATPLTITSAASAVGSVGVAFDYGVNLSSLPPYAYPPLKVTFSASGLPPGLSMTNGAIVGTPNTPGIYQVPISVSSYTKSSGGSTVPTTATATITIVISPTAQAVQPVPPVITSAASVNASGAAPNLYDFSPTEVAPFSYQILATNQPTSFGATGLPPGLTVDPATGLIYGWWPTFGTYTVPISATNSVGTSTAVLTIIVAGKSPSFTTSADVAAYVGQPCSVSVASTQPSFLGGSSLYPVYSASGLPPGLTLNTITGAIVGAPAATGTYPTTVTATSGAGTIQEVVTFVVSAMEDAPQAAPVFTSAVAAASAAVGAPFTYSAWANAIPSGFTATNLPPGLSLSVQTGLLNGVSTKYAQISGTPTAAGTYSVPMTATNDAGSGTMTATIVVAAAAPPPTIVSNSFATGSPGVAFDRYITGQDEITGTTDYGSVTYAATGLPDGLTVDPTSGLISGTPTTT